MNYFENRFFNIGFILILISAGITSLFVTNSILQIVGGVIAAIGMIVMFYGVRQFNKKA